MKQILITGASGFWGWNFCRLHWENYEITGVVNHHPVKMPGVDIVQTDLTSYREMKQLMGDVSPDAVIHAAAMADAIQCAEYPVESRKINVDASANLAGLCSDSQIPLLFISTDLVFDGKNPPYSESDAPNPVNLYGEQKAKAEEEMQQRYPEVTVARLPLMYGLPGPVAGNFFMSFLRKMKSEEQLALFKDEFRSTVDVESAISGVLIMLGKVPGIIHLGGKISVSRYEFGRLMADVFQINQPNIHPAHQADIPMAADRPANVTLDSARAFALGYDPLLPIDGLKRVRKQMQREGMQIQ